MSSEYGWTAMLSDLLSIRANDEFRDHDTG